MISAAETPGFCLVVARDRSEIGDALKLRERVYAEEGLVGSGANCTAGPSPRDFYEHTSHLVVYRGGDPVGTLRLTTCRSVPRDGCGLGFEIERTFRLRGFTAPGIVPAEVTRFCVERRYRGTRVAALLYSGLLAESARQRVTHLVAAGNLETDSAEDAALAFRLLERAGWVDRRFAATTRGLADAPPTPTRPLYTEAERHAAREPGGPQLALPRTVALFATKMSARTIGAPAYESHFGVFALPLVVDLDAAVRARKLQPLACSSEPRAGGPYPSSGI